MSRGGGKRRAVTLGRSAVASVQSEPWLAPESNMTDRVSKPLTLQEKHEIALAKVAKFTRLAALPDLSPGEAALALTMKRSAIAELKLSQKALDYAKPHEDPQVEKALVLYRLFRLPLPRV
jgi:hypothetical protein